MNLEVGMTIAGLALPFVVVPAVKVLVNMRKTQNAHALRISRLEQSQTWTTQSLQKIENNQETMRTEVNDKLDMVVNHLLGVKGKK